MDDMSNKVRFNQSKKDTKTSHNHLPLSSHRHRHADATARLEFGTAGPKDVGDHFGVVFGLEIVADVPEGVDTAHLLMPSRCQVVRDLIDAIFGHRAPCTCSCSKLDSFDSFVLISRPDDLALIFEPFCLFFQRQPSLLLIIAG